MAEIIKDGRTGDTAKVDANNRLHVQARTLEIGLAETLDGQAYDLSPGILSLSTDSSSALIYVKNTGDKALIVETIFIDSTSSTNGTGTGYLNWVLNPTGGTLVDAATSVTILNRRIGNAVSLSANAYKPTAEGQTLTGGDSIRFPLIAGVGIPFGKNFVIPKGQSFGIVWEPPTGNTSMEIQAGILLVIDTSSDQ